MENKDNVEVVEENKNDVRELKQGGVKKFGKVEKDTLPKRDVVIDGDFEIIQTTKYKSKKVTTFESSDAKCFSRHLENEAVKKSIREAFPKEIREYIFNSKGFEGDLVDFIAIKYNKDRKEIFEEAKSLEAIENIPSYMKARASRTPAKDVFYC